MSAAATTSTRKVHKTRDSVQTKFYFVVLCEEQKEEKKPKQAYKKIQSD